MQTTSILALFVLAGGANASLIVTISTTCSVGSQSQSGTSCSLIENGWKSDAYGVGSFQQVPNSAFWVMNAIPVANVITDGSTGSGSAHASVTVSAFFTSDLQGPGYVGVFLTRGVQPSIRIAGQIPSLVLPSQFLAVPIASFASPFEITLTATALDIVSCRAPFFGCDEQFAGGGGAILNFEAFAADGVTPVQMVDPDPPGLLSTPEPSTFGTGLLALFMAWRKIRPAAVLRS